MKKIVIILILLLLVNTNAYATSGKLRQDSITICDGLTYGRHGSDNHLHIATRNIDGTYSAYGNQISSISCSKNDDQPSSKIIVTLSECVDGDTAWFNLNDIKTKFRFLAIDTPETVHPTKEIELYGKDASNYTCRVLTKASKIEIEYENSNLTDKYGRHLAWIWVDDNLLQKDLVSLGYAKVAYIYGNYQYTDMLCEIEKAAFISKVGLWQEKNHEDSYCGSLKKDQEEYFLVTFQNGDTKAEREVLKGKTTSSLEISTVEGNNFLGWYLEGKKFDFQTPITKDIILEATYQKKTNLAYCRYFFYIIICTCYLSYQVIKKLRKK